MNKKLMLRVTLIFATILLLIVIVKSAQVIIGNREIKVVFEEHMETIKSDENIIEHIEGYSFNDAQLNNIGNAISKAKYKVEEINELDNDIVEVIYTVDTYDVQQHYTDVFFGEKEFLTDGQKDVLKTMNSSTDEYQEVYKIMEKEFSSMIAYTPYKYKVYYINGESGVRLVDENDLYNVLLKSYFDNVNALNK